MSRGPSLVFIGFMGAGKSGAARLAGSALGVPAIDSDLLVEQELGMPVADFFDRHGEGAFRECEERVVCELLDRADGEVIALGGGSVTIESVRAALHRHVAVLLEVSPETAWQRASGHGRPLARDRERFLALHAERLPLYERVADAFMPGDREAVRDALPALTALLEKAAGSRMVWASGASPYPVHIGRGLLGSRFSPAAPGRRFVVTDTAVGGLYGPALEPAAARIEVEPGEEHKTLATAEQVWSALAAGGMTRGDHVAAVGGGVVGDLAGFCAATYQRGVACVQVPTTLVAQVDSAYGGKTGIDLPAAKNYVGAYHQPAAVLVDPATLATLPPAELAAGYAEVLKTALLAGGGLWDQVAGGASHDDGVILACLRHKVAVVAADERDAGVRQQLNLGHTVGHAIESATGYRRYRHGEAVALGLLAALRLSGLDALRAQCAELLAARGLPLRLEGTEPEAVAALTGADKKRVSATAGVPFVLLAGPGQPLVGQAVPDHELLAAVRELAA